ncbi:MAG: hypothetical protein CVU05_14215 [Bacteroidetes bacterium HGW-Bacteroidetes-21]|jgi:hypothetical protein|nr:MAG: hypothetical protein CVU05_14215 [Bacteroidetes bacterium HGW-Bacteroidetes-21]
MIKVNEYFGGNVKSMAINAGDYKATVGVMLPGEYEFGTSTEERMLVTEGQIEAMLPGETQWNAYKAGQDFHVPANVKFQVRIKMDTSYICYYK